MSATTGRDAAAMDPTGFARECGSRQAERLEDAPRGYEMFLAKTDDCEKMVLKT